MALLPGEHVPEEVGQHPHGELAGPVGVLLAPGGELVDRVERLVLDSGELEQPVAVLDHRLERLDVRLVAVGDRLLDQVVFRVEEAVVHAPGVDADGCLVEVVCGVVGGLFADFEQEVGVPAAVHRLVGGLLYNFATDFVALDPPGREARRRRAHVHRDRTEVPLGHGAMLPHRPQRTNPSRLPPSTVMVHPVVRDERASLASQATASATSSGVTATLSIERSL